MHNTNSAKAGVLAIGAILALFVINYLIYEYRYKQGQVDALSGKVKFELKIQDDSTRVWQEIKTNDNKNIK